MKTATIEIYQFNELSDSAKETARAWYRQISESNEWWEFVFEDAKLIGGLMGIDIDEIYFSGFCSQGDGACFTGRYAYRKGSAKAVKSEAPQDTKLAEIVDGLAEVQRRYFYGLSATIEHTGRYFNTEINHYRENEYITIFEDGPEWWVEVDELLRDFMRWIYTRLESEYEYLNSDEQIDESIRCNEYEFTANGDIY